MGNLSNRDKVKSLFLPHPRIVFVQEIVQRCKGGTQL